MNEDWPNQLAALLAQNQPPDSYWDMMAQGDTLPAMMSDQAKNAYIARVQGFQPPPQQPQRPQPQANIGLSTQQGGTQAAADKKLQQQQLQAILRARGQL